MCVYIYIYVERKKAVCIIPVYKPTLPVSGMDGFHELFIVARPYAHHHYNV